ncbi:GspH/FimT family pseudopilin [Pseudomonas gingeri]|uniref:GspH/FimT family pseudopilin n=1 Tax=Pseudomonas gingeri TaxID=117681 RepID=UPI0015A1410D|nr:GspH/FimT family pseudopilin [Pseudomonas gingeri]NWA26723.1 GspH/FimT family pseudopilin [Pseudomonas gingeri]NWD70535.1 GspH/FimT family pseudopilin [Pseudomonas gingeri]
MFQGAKGFTLVELLVAIAVLAILTAIAAPSFNSTIQKSRVDSEASDLQRALNYTRLEAINRGVNVRIGPTSGAGSNWTTGQSTTTGATTGTNLRTKVLRVIPAMSSTTTMAASTVTFIEFNNLGALVSPATAVSLSFVEGSYTNTLSVCLTGRIALNGSCP